MRPGRFAASLALAALALSGAGCESTEDSMTSPLSCVPLTGLYTATIRDSCGNEKTMDVTLFQSGCTAVAQLPGIGNLAGTVSGGTLVFSIDFSPCGGSASGSMTVTTDGGLSGSYSGQASGGGPCCGAVTGTAVLTRR